jgi:beta-D-xylosidase 4
VRAQQGAAHSHCLPLPHLFSPLSPSLPPSLPPHSLSYTTFAFQWFDSLGELSVAAEGFFAAPPQYAVNVTNTGPVTSDVSVLGMVSSGLPGEPLQELFDFGRLAALAPGETRTVTLTLPAGIAATVSAAGDRMLLPGLYTVRVGEPGNWASTTLSISGQPTLVTPQQAA